MSPNLVIIQLLHTQSSHVEFLRLCWDKLSAEQKKEIFYFLYHGGQYKTFLTTLRLELNSASPIVPWTHLFSVLMQMDKITHSQIKNLLDANPSNEEMGLFRLDNPDLSLAWTNKKKQINAKHKEKKEELLKSLDFARQQNLKDQRLRILNELKGLYPKDEDVATIMQSEKEYRARQNLNRILAKRQNQPHQYMAEQDVDVESVKALVKSAKKICKSKPQMCLDIAIMFYSMELYTEALVIFDLIKEKNVNVMWHELHICIEGRQYARALTIIQQLRHQNLSTDHSFSLLYYQALAMYGLGKQLEAKQIIRKIVKIRPNFKSANSLLLEWETEK